MSLGSEEDKVGGMRMFSLVLDFPTGTISEANIAMSRYHVDD